MNDRAQISCWAMLAKGLRSAFSSSSAQNPGTLQVASHAQKYFIRLNSMNKKDKRRSSIHDITSPGGNTGEVTGNTSGSRSFLRTCFGI